MFIFHVVGVEVEGKFTCL